jgi:hypothetical protein
MPHSLTPEPVEAQDDIVLPDAPASDDESSSSSQTAPGSVKPTEPQDSDKENMSDNAKLEDMFDDEDENDEFSSSNPTSSAEAQSSAYVDSPEPSGLD